jgi:TetR/AcrR family transcriptional regulator, transcriptional repressor for nem operon
LGLAKRLKPGVEKMTSDRAGRPATLADLLDTYLSFDHRDNLAAGCPMSASASEVARQNKIVSERFTEGFEQVAALIERGLEDSPVTDKHQRALAMMAAMIGGVAASRAVAKADPRLSNEILRAVRQIVAEVGGEEVVQVDGTRGRARATRKRAS